LLIWQHYCDMGENMLESAKTDHRRALDGISQLQAQMTFRFSVLSKLLDRQMSDIAGDFGLSLAAYRALATIAAFGETAAADLVRYTGYDKAAISRTVVELDKLGLIDVRTDPNHGRRKILRVSDTGQGLLTTAAPLVEARRDGLSAQLTDEEERVFLRAIEKLAAHVADDLSAAKRSAA